MITTDDHAANPYKVVFADGQVSGWLRPDSIKSSGLNMSFELEMAMAASAHEVRAACESKLPEATQPAVRPGRVILSEAEVLFIKAFVLLGHLLQVSCPLTTFSPPQRLRDYDALHHKRYGLSIHYHALSLMCDRFGISCFSLRFTSSDVQRRHCEVN